MTNIMKADNNSVSITQNPWYSEGAWAGKRMIPNIDKTEYKDIESAIKIKQTLIERFETEFGFSRDGLCNRDYAFNLGILDTLIEHHAKTSKDGD